MRCHLKLLAATVLATSAVSSFAITVKFVAGAGFVASINGTFVGEDINRDGWIDSDDGEVTSMDTRLDAPSILPPVDLNSFLPEGPWSVRYSVGSNWIEEWLQQKGGGSTFWRASVGPSDALRERYVAEVFVGSGINCCFSTLRTLSSQPDPFFATVVPEVPAVPEPSSYLAFLAGLSALALARRSARGRSVRQPGGRPAHAPREPR